MGKYLNPDHHCFKEVLSKPIYVDKSLLIDLVSNYARGINDCICFCKPKGFGKSTDADMLVAYFSKGCDSHELSDFLNVKFPSDFYCDKCGSTHYFFIQSRNVYE